MSYHHSVDLPERSHQHTFVPRLYLGGVVTGLPPGEKIVRLELAGHQTEERTVIVQKGKRSHIDVKLLKFVYLDIQVIGQGAVAKDSDKPKYIEGETVELTTVPET